MIETYNLQYTKNFVIPHKNNQKKKKINIKLIEKPHLEMQTTY